MGKIDLSINKTGLEHNIQKAKENNIIIPTIAQMQNPDSPSGKHSQEILVPLRSTRQGSGRT